jgi:hypothetical protein
VTRTSGNEWLVCVVCICSVCVYCICPVCIVPSYVPFGSVVKCPHSDSVVQGSIPTRGFFDFDIFVTMTCVSFCNVYTNDLVVC